MSETLRQKQSRFALDMARLILKAYEMEFEVTVGEVWRAPEQAKWNADHGKGISNSLHLDRLAVDLNLFKDGLYLAGSESYRPLGEWWMSLGPDYAWGGLFKPRADGNHFSLAFEGRK